MRCPGACPLFLVLLGMAACSVKLPEPESPGAKIYAARCSGCHRLSEPGVLKFEMWKVKVEAMQGEMARRGVPPLTVEERSVLLDYLQRHAG